MKKSLYTKAQKAFSEALVLARKSAGLTQQELADRLRKPQSFVAKYENSERRLDVVEFIVISQHLGIDASAVIRTVSAHLDG